MPRRLAVAATALAVLALALLAWRAGARFEHHLEDVLHWVDSLGPWAPAAFVLGYVILVPALFPESVLMVATGATLGFVRGTATAMAGIFASGAVIYALARVGLVHRVEAWVARYPKLASVDVAVDRGGPALLLWLRVPPVPYAIVSYALACTRVRFLPYWLTCVGRLPEVLMTVYIGYAARHLARVAGGVSRATPLHHVAVVVGLLLTVAATLALARIARRVLREKGLEL